MQRAVKDIDYGYVGDIQRVNDKFLISLISQDIIPVLAPITHDNKGQLLNTNADTIASAIASSLTKSFDVDLYYCFEKKGVLSDVTDQNSVISILVEEEFRALVDRSIVASGMVPKLTNGFAALNNGVKNVFIGDIEGLSDLQSVTKLSSKG